MKDNYLALLKRDEKKILVQIHIRKNVLKAIKTLKHYLNLVHKGSTNYMRKPE